ncbi:fructokinase [Halogranum amylolyticum]|uniref:Fructokinase n=1 Tax=Halogranum amylolyticum TaxID=660520 RepID=A0A1H8U545_9EURY|nr:carbohydrate kinase [Halogranum amylolyticum]SEO98412.1 fructokinase [Halogranum amylolyticum]
MPRILVAGETLIDFIPDAPGPLASVDSFDKRAGGAPANVAVGLARLDADVDFWTRVGDDAFGDFLVETLADEGLSGELVERDSEAQTTLAFVSLGEDADREFSFYHDRTADTRMEPGTVDDDELADYDWVHVDVLSLDTEPSRDAVVDLAERARMTDSIVSFDPNSRPERWGEFSYVEAAKQGFRLADVVKATPEDLREAGFEGDAADLARQLCEFGPHTVLVTLGDEGSYAYATADAPWADEETEVTHDGYSVDPVDTTGAGDAFTAGAIAALSEGEPLSEALAFGNAVAATTTTAGGAMTALPTREAVRTFREQ